MSFYFAWNVNRGRVTDPFWLSGWRRTWESRSLICLQSIGMKVLILAKTRRGPGACVGGITQDGRSVRLVALDAATNERAGLEYGVGEVWELETAPVPEIIPPHVENILVLSAR